MKTFILTTELKVTDESIAKARKWEKRKNYRYGDDVGHLLIDCIADGEDIGHEIEKIELDEEIKPVPSILRPSNIVAELCSAKELWNKRDKLSAVKIVRESLGVHLKEAKEYCEKHFD